MKAIFLILFILSNSACSGQEIKFYSDFNLMTLKGITQLSEIKYPCFGIQEMKDRKKITFYFTKEKKEIRSFINKNNYWRSDFIQKTDTAILFTVQIVASGKVYEYNFTDSLHQKLYDYGVFSNDSIVYYNYSGLPVKVDIESGKVKSTKWNYKIGYTFKKSNLNCALIATTTLSNNYSKSVFTRCYSDVIHSFIAIYLFADYLNEIKCSQN